MGPFNGNGKNKNRFTNICTIFFHFAFQNLILIFIQVSEFIHLFISFQFYHYELCMFIFFSISKLIQSSNFQFRRKNKIGIKLRCKIRWRYWYPLSIENSHLIIVLLSLYCIIIGQFSKWIRRVLNILVSTEKKNEKLLRVLDSFIPLVTRQEH